MLKDHVVVRSEEVILRVGYCKVVKKFGIITCDKVKNITANVGGREKKLRLKMRSQKRFEWG